MLSDIDFGGSMKIYGEKTFILNEIDWLENEIIPLDELDEMSSYFIQYYKDWNFDKLAFNQGGQELSVTIALCTLDEEESWKSVSSKLDSDGWSGASIAMWKLYVQNERSSLSENVALPGTIYRDENIEEWVLIAINRPVISIIGILRGNETRISMKPYSSLNLQSSAQGSVKIRTLLISKTEVLKT